MEKRLERIKHLRHITGIGLRAAIDIVDAGKDGEMIAEWGDKAPASLPNLPMMMAPLMPGHPARKDYDALLGEVESLKRLLSELHTLVWGKYPALLDGERLDARIEEALG